MIRITLRVKIFQISWLLTDNWFPDWQCLSQNVHYVNLSVRFVRTWSCQITSLCEAPLHMHSGQVQQVSLNNITFHGRQQKVRTSKLSHKNPLASCSQLPPELVFPWKCFFAPHLCHQLPVLNNWGGHILACSKGAAFSSSDTFNLSVKASAGVVASSWIKHCAIKAQRECYLAVCGSTGPAGSVCTRVPETLKLEIALQLHHLTSFSIYNPL